MKISNKGWIVTFAGVGLNLAIGFLFSWSIIKEGIKKSIELGGQGAFNWKLENLNDPYSLCCLVFSFSMILGGKCQDKLGPRITSFIGGLLIGTGLIFVSFTTSYWLWLAGFGILCAIGIGFCFSSATPAALKWFPSTKAGTIVGIVVSGVGLAGIYIPPIENYLFNLWGFQSTMLFFGVSFLIIIPTLALLLFEPPKDYFVEDIEISKEEVSHIQMDFKPRQVLTSKLFLLVWLLFFIGSGAGLMVISSVSEMAKKSLGEQSFITVAVLSLGNAGGRIFAGILSDKIGRGLTLLIMLLFQSGLMFLSILIFGNDVSFPIAVIFMATFIGFNYGTNLSIFPALTKDLWGINSFGINYGFLFTAWGLGGFIVSIISQLLFTASKSFTASFILAGVLLIIGAFLTIILRKKILIHNLSRKI
jgi:MFS transporter, OFA family, oxalate/formate antiporter